MLIINGRIVWLSGWGISPVSISPSRLVRYVDGVALFGGDLRVSPLPAPPLRLFPWLRSKPTVVDDPKRRGYFGCHYAALGGRSIPRVLLLQNSRPTVEAGTITLSSFGFPFCLREFISLFAGI